MKDYETMIKVNKETRDKLRDLKYDYRVSSFDKLINLLIDIADKSKTIGDK